ncbi:PilZ domain-containing protein [Paenibacillus taiwanensis]|uniref:PilZ domain-containing protein n=1 Tax=Paenibacillus taiwanensis TaxID=401638 RepID=UPI00040E8616|nr:PilZ domain-containing protein [Paenibacillus taiwanensis]
MDANNPPYTMSLRIALHNPIIASMSISHINQHRIEAVKTSKVLVTAISPGGLRMLSNLDLPLQAETDYSLRFEFELQDVYLSIDGCPVWSRLTEGMYEYSVRWQLNQNEKRLLLRLLNEKLINMMPQQKRIHHMYRTLSTLALSTNRTRFHTS